MHAAVSFFAQRQVSGPKEAISVLKLTTASDLHLACCPSACAAGACRDPRKSTCACMPRWISFSDFFQRLQILGPREPIPAQKHTTASDMQTAGCPGARAAGARRDPLISTCACMPRWISLDGGRFQVPKKPFLQRNLPRHQIWCWHAARAPAQQAAPGAPS